MLGIEMSPTGGQVLRRSADDDPWAIYAGPRAEAVVWSQRGFGDDLDEVAAALLTDDVAHASGDSDGERLAERWRSLRTRQARARSDSMAA